VKRALVIGAIVAGWATGARASPCSPPDLLETMPQGGASGVPTNARPAARYAPSAEYLGEAIVFEHDGVGPEPTTASFNANEGLLTLAPDAPLVPNDHYRITWPALRGLTTAMLGKGGEVQFTAGGIEDGEAPKFAGLGSIAWDIERENDDCTDSPQDRFRFDFVLGDASDDGPRDMLTLVVFQTSGPGAQGSPKPVLIQRMPERGEEAHVRRPIDETVGEVCFAALVRDSLGRTSDSSDRQVCVKTVRPPFFYGCAVSSRRGSSGGMWLVLAGLGAVRARAWRRPRPRRLGGAACPWR
jgi:hypothetical protein